MLESLPEFLNMLLIFVYDFTFKHNLIAEGPDLLWCSFEKKAKVASICLIFVYWIGIFIIGCKPAAILSFFFFAFGDWELLS